MSKDIMSEEIIKPKIDIEKLIEEAKVFAEKESSFEDASLFNIKNGKSIGTYMEQKFKNHLSDKYVLDSGNSSSGIDLPDLNIDIKTTSIDKPQSSSPFDFPQQKIFGLGYSLVIFVYNRIENIEKQTARFEIVNIIFVEEYRTADYQMTTGLKQILNNKANADDIVAFLNDKNLPINEGDAYKIAEEVLGGKEIPDGYLTISNALQWRLKYGRVITEAGKVDGIQRIK